MLSVDWEGDTLRSANLKALANFNKEFPNYPVIHFLNPAYYTKKNFLSPAEINKRIRTVLKPGDDIGLHIHAWESLIRSAGVRFRDRPSFWGPVSLGRGGERGDDVPLNTYTEKELTQIIRHSLKLLSDNGFSDIHSFRAGGWTSGPKVYRALVKNDIFIDSSAVPAELIANLYPGTRLYELNHKLWPDINLMSKPFKLIVLKQNFYEYPNNIGLADYVSTENFISSAKKLIEDGKKSHAKNLYLHFGWHQESAVEYFEHTKEGGQKLVQAHFLNRVEKGLNELQVLAAEQNVEIVPISLSHYQKLFFEKNNP